MCWALLATWCVGSRITKPLEELEEEENESRPCLESPLSGMQGQGAVAWLKAKVRAGRGGAGLGWLGQLASNGVLYTDSILPLGGRLTSCRVEECYRLVNYILKNILSTPLK